MAIVIHKIAGNYYAYEHYREGKEIKCEYLYPVSSGNKLKLVLIDEFKDKNNQQWAGMNYYAAKELKIDYPYNKNTVVVVKNKNRQKQNETIRHEVAEIEEMKKGKKYKEAHKIGLIVE